MQKKRQRCGTRLDMLIKKYKSGMITSLQIPVTWPSSNCDEGQIRALDNLKEAQHWRTVETP
eukprot:15114990-Ditylum_brightwellii.AAC.1